MSDPTAVVATDYAPAAAVSLRAFAEGLRRLGARASLRTTLELLDALERAPRFVLPNGGRYLGIRELGPQDLVGLQPPHPVVVLEFPAEGVWSTVVGNRASSSRRIVVVRELDPVAAARLTSPKDPLERTALVQGGLLVQAVSFLDAEGEWAPMSIAALLPRVQSADYVAETAAMSDAVLEASPEYAAAVRESLPHDPIFPARADGAFFAGVGFCVVPQLPEMFADVDADPAELFGDLMDEVWATVDFLLALRSGEYRVRPLRPTGDLDRARRRRGKAPAPGYQVLERRPER